MAWSADLSSRGSAVGRAADSRVPDVRGAGKMKMKNKMHVAGGVRV